METLIKFPIVTIEKVSVEGDIVARPRIDIDLPAIVRSR